MTEPNKELPKEVQDSIRQAVKNGIDHRRMEISIDRIVISITSVFEVYNMLQLSSKDKEIERLKAEKEELHKMVSEKEAANSKTTELLKDYVRLDYDVMVEHMRAAKVAAPSFKWYLWDYCKENGIDLGGE